MAPVTVPDKRVADVEAWLAGLTGEGGRRCVILRFLGRPIAWRATWFAGGLTWFVDETPKHGRLTCSFLGHRELAETMIQKRWQVKEVRGVPK